MTPKEREDNLYRNGKRCRINIEEKALLGLLDQYSVPRELLDIGCGSGEITCVIKDKGYQVTGVDFSPVAIELAKEQGINCQLVDLDTGLPFDDNSFDIVWAGDVIEHVLDPIFVVKEISRVLRPDGQLLCTVPYNLNLVARLKILLGHSYQEVAYRERKHYKHHTFFSLSLLRYMLSEAGFKIRNIKYAVRIPKLIRYITKCRAMIYFADTMIIRATVRK